MVKQPGRQSHMGWDPQAIVSLLLFGGEVDWDALGLVDWDALDLVSHALAYTHK
jgi:hypothetical protein